MVLRARPGWIDAPETGLVTLADGTEIQLVETAGCRCAFCKAQRRRRG